VSIKLENYNFEKVLTLWSNTTIGLLIYWWHASKQQSGRGTIGKVSLSDFPILDVKMIGQSKMEKAKQIFDDFADKELLPVHEIGIDQNRKLLDKVFLGEVLDFPQSIIVDGGPLDILRTKLGLEPSIRGGK